MLSLPTDEIHVWLVFHDSIVGREYTKYRALLSEQELEQEQRFYFEKDRRRHVITRALVRTTLSRYVALAPEKWTFVVSEYGRPEIANSEAAGRRLSFNVSHASNLTVLALAAQRSVGIDTENVCDRSPTVQLARACFAPIEIAELDATPPEERHERFLEYWTLKEAYIKARGMGLSLPLNEFSFKFPRPGRVTFEVGSTLDDDANRWQFWQFRPVPEYVAALCAQRMPGAASSAPVITRTVGPGAFQTQSPRFLRFSE